MDFAGPIAGVLVAVLISNLSLHSGFRRRPFGDRRAKALFLWITVVLVDVGAFAAFAAGYGVVEGLEDPDLSGIVGWVLAGAAVPLALRSPVREAEIGGTKRPVGLTYVYDWIRAQFEIPLDARLTELRRSDERATAERLANKGYSFDQVKAELEEHLDQAQRFSDEDKVGLKNKIASVETLAPPKNLRGLVKIAQEARAGALIERLLEETPQADPSGSAPN